MVYRETVPMKFGLNCAKHLRDLSEELQEQGSGAGSTMAE